MPTMETIVALATAPLKSALALIRVSGDEAFSYTERLLGKPIYIKDKAELRHGTLSYEGKTLDDVMLLCYPNSFLTNAKQLNQRSTFGSVSKLF